MKKTKYYFKKFKTIDVIAGDQENLRRVVETLRFIEKKEPKFFKQIQKLRAIIVRRAGTYNNSFFPKELVYVCEPATIREASQAYLSSLLVHEGVHIKQYTSKRTYIGDVAEEEAYKTQKKFLKKYGTDYEVEWLDEIFKKKWWVKKDKKGKIRREFLGDKNNRLAKICEDYTRGKLK